MNADADSESSTAFIDRQKLAGALLTGAPVGIQVLVPLVWPELDHALGLILLALCAFAFVAGVFLLWVGQRKPTIGVQRRWKIVGFGQGWVEARVRNDAGDQVVVSWNAGAGADQITIWVTFRKRSKGRRSNTVEMIFNVEGTSFEWDVPDPGGSEFTLSGETWRDVEAIKSMLAVMRQHRTLSLLVPTLGLRAQFTLDGAFDILEEVSSLGEAQRPLHG